jgi:hypothetical protein
MKHYLGFVAIIAALFPLVIFLTACVSSFFLWSWEPFRLFGIFKEPTLLRSIALIALAFGGWVYLEYRGL